MRHAVSRGSTTLRLMLYSSPFARLLGYPSSVHSKSFRRPTAPQWARPRSLRSRPRASSFFGDDVRDQPAPRAAFRSLEGWQPVTLTPGWYMPSHRTLCPGQPLRLPPSSRWPSIVSTLPSPSASRRGRPPAHFLMFTDPAGVVHNCRVYPGKYSPRALARCLETEMTRLAANSLPGTVYTVEFEDGRFTQFGCEVRESSTKRESRALSLLFSHPAQFEPTRLGFAASSLHGLDSYTPSHRVMVPTTSNACSRQERDPHQQRLRVATPPPQRTCVIEHYDTKRSMLRVRTYSGQLPFVHGLRVGAPVILGSVGGTQELYHYSSETSEWRRPYRAAPVHSGRGRSAVVVDSPHGDAQKPSLPSGEHLELWLRVKPTPALVDCTGTVLTVQQSRSPSTSASGSRRASRTRRWASPRAPRSGVCRRRGRERQHARASL